MTTEGYLTIESPTPSVEIKPCEVVILQSHIIILLLHVNPNLTGLDDLTKWKGAKGFLPVLRRLTDTEGRLQQGLVHDHILGVRTLARWHDLKRKCGKKVCPNLPGTSLTSSNSNRHKHTRHTHTHTHTSVRAISRSRSGGQHRLLHKKRQNNKRNEQPKTRRVVK